jgi:hypothetical protein
MTLYRIAYALGLVWFVGFCYLAATRPENQNAGFWVAMLILGIAVAPCGALWIGRRVVTGRWL